MVMIRRILIVISLFTGLSFVAVLSMGFLDNSVAIPILFILCGFSFAMTILSFTIFNEHKEFQFKLLSKHKLIDIDTAKFIFSISNDMRLWDVWIDQNIYNRELVSKLITYKNAHKLKMSYSKDKSVDNLNTILGTTEKHPDYEVWVDVFSDFDVVVDSLKRMI